MEEETEDADPHLMRPVAVTEEVMVVEEVQDMPIILPIIVVVTEAIHTMFPVQDTEDTVDLVQYE
jgi:hypothetical protein